MRVCRFLLFILFCLVPAAARAGAIHDAAKIGDAAGIASALDGGADANQSNGLAAPLYYAAAGGHDAAMKVLIERGAKADVEGIWGPPVVAAASSGNVDTVNLLIAAGADPNGHFKTRTALHIAAEKGFLNIVKALVEAGADVNAQTLFTETAIYLAKFHKRHDVAAYLMDHGVILPKPPPISAKFAASDAVKGKEVFSRECASCHFDERGRGTKIGPELWGVVGRDKASMPAVGYSDALVAWAGAWTYEDLNILISNPMVTTPGTLMKTAGLEDEARRVDLISYLRTLSDDPLPLPEN